MERRNNSGKRVPRAGERSAPAGTGRRSNRCSHSDWYNRSSDYKARMHGWR